MNAMIFIKELRHKKWNEWYGWNRIYGLGFGTGSIERSAMCAGPDPACWRQGAAEPAPKREINTGTALPDEGRGLQAAPKRINAGTYLEEAISTNFEGSGLGLGPGWKEKTCCFGTNTTEGLQEIKLPAAYRSLHDWRLAGQIDQLRL